MANIEHTNSFDFIPMEIGSDQMHFYHYIFIWFNKIENIKCSK